MTHRRSFSLFLALFLVGLAGALPAQGPVRRPQPAGQELLGQVFNIIATTAVDSIPADSLYERAARGLIASLKDPYAAILSPAEQARFQRQSLGNRYAGIGALVRSRGGHVTLFRVFDGAPASRAGLASGDRILKVEDREVSGLPVDSVTAMLLGVPATPVRVTYERYPDLKPVTTTVTRGIIRTPAVPFTLLLDGTIGYVPIHASTRPRPRMWTRRCASSRGTEPRASSLMSVATRAATSMRRPRWPGSFSRPERKQRECSTVASHR